MQITPEEIAETLAMVSKQHLDIRTITLGLNLRSCTDSDINTMARKVYDKMTKAAEQLVPTAEQLEREFGIPIVNKRISVTPIAEICAAVPDTDLSRIAVAMDKAGARNAAWLAAQILAVADPALDEKIRAARAKMQAGVEEAAAEIEAKYGC